MEQASREDPAGPVTDRRRDTASGNVTILTRAGSGEHIQASFSVARLQSQVVHNRALSSVAILNPSHSKERSDEPT